LEYRVVANLARTPLIALFWRTTFVLAIVLGLSVHFTPQAAAIENLRRFAGIVVDARSGQVMYEEAADARRYPASVAKVMTLYILFQELEAGNLRLDTRMTVSRHAAAAVPTKLGLRAGSQITVENAIKALVTLSANDIARVIAEHISGTESRFAERMTATARALGMRNTTYRNASGLPDGAQITTVRDQAILGIAVFQHFPRYYEYFQTRSFTYGGRTYGNHNRVLGYMNAVDGIKTGYINAAGSNLLTAARRDNRHIVVVAFGFNSAAARDERVRQLVSTYLPRARSGSVMQTAMIPRPGAMGTAPVAVAQSSRPVPVTPAPLPGFRLAELVALNGARPAPIATASAAAAPAPVPAAPPVPAPPPAQSAAQAAAGLAGQPDSPSYPANDIIGAWLSETYSLGAPPSALGQTAPSAPLTPPANVGVDPTTSNSVSDAAPVGGWVVQVGATPSEQTAQTLLGDAVGRLQTLTDYRGYVERFERTGQTYYRARFTGFAGRDDATEICNQLKAQNLTCLAMQS
jgi:D-alanyl-D-alanine carboxypeptidase